MHLAYQADVEEAIAQLASRQHGLLRMNQLAEVGISRKVMARRVARGRWMKVHPTVLRVAGTPVTWESQVLSHVLAAGEGAVASHRTAAVLWGLDGVHRTTPEIAIPARLKYRSPEARVHYSKDLHRVHSDRRSGIPCTPVARTLLDLGAVLPEEVVLVAIDSARRRRQTDWGELLHTLETHARRGRDGVGTLRRILDRHFAEAELTDSAFERLVITVLLQAGLPRPVLQHEVEVGGHRYRLDLAYPGPRIAIELDGSVHMDRRVWEADHVRQNALVLGGWTILRFTWRDYSTGAGRLVREVRYALAAASPSALT